MPVNLPMPSGQHLQQQSADQSPHTEQQPQIKLCTKCSCPLNDPSAIVYLTSLGGLVCPSCRDQLLAPRPTVLLLPDAHPDCLDPHQEQFSSEDEKEVHSPTKPIVDVFEHCDLPPSPRANGLRSQHHSLPTPPTYVDNEPSFPQVAEVPLTDSYSTPLRQSTPPPVNQTTIANQRTIHVTRHGSPPPQYASALDPLVDITRLRVPPQVHHCLYPGATFIGTQKSGRNSYDVTVTIVDIDFAASFLCGYLRIKGLTDDWPELTTYFDAEIIGSRYGFLTKNWGATEAEDIVHWSRFPAFRHVKHEIKKPHHTMPDRDRGAVFMRWKERFLVPDHRVQDINGASFAGFYYVCVDFNPPASCATSSQGSGTLEDEEAPHPSSFPKADASGRRRRNSSSRRGKRSTSMVPRHSAPVARMSGFYYHQNSEPYQQLTLDHVPQRASSIFELR
ncbi:hypothetical protein AX16_008886 [Volvariella volvacea WC 439]|nr:hypothetical protein AX16_008886 [Volvariella volvacea WC 439]